MTPAERATLDTPQCQRALTDIILRVRRGDKITAADGAAETKLSAQTFVEIWLTVCKPIFEKYLGAGSTLH